MSGSDLHKSAIVIDALVISKWSRAVFEEMRAGGITAASCTTSVWEGFQTTMTAIAQWKRWFREHADIILPVRKAADIRRAKAEGKVGIILSWQNTAAIDNDIRNLELFHDVGVRIVQITYNTQNLVGCGCLERFDPGLSDFGREVVAELNRLGILIDLSHVGPKTAEDTILLSKQPVCYTHCAPRALYEHARNKTDAELRFMVDHGGFVGFSTYPVFLPKGYDTTVDDCVAAMEHVVDVVGEDNVGIGTDFLQDQDKPFYDWVAHDKGTARRILVRRDDGPPRMPKGFERLSQFGNLTAAMERRGWTEGRIRKVMGENWLRVFGATWGG
ncbi:MAG: dipeptidase [Alphaproteobacteria bacterium]|nr:dipeptidase [Alphaproteobacteria bacterium]